MGGNLILGGNGFIGSAICRKLVSMGESVIVMDHGCMRKENFEGIENKIDYRQQDFANVAAFFEATKNIDRIYYCITSTYPAQANEDPVYDAQTNILGFLRILPFTKGKRFVFLSSGGTVYGEPQALPISEEHPNNPISSYGVAKLTVEKYLYSEYKNKGLDYVIFRISNPYGERQDPTAGFGFIISTLYKIKTNTVPITIFGKDTNTRDYIFIDDAAEAIVKVGSSQTLNHRVYNIGSGCETSIRCLLDIIYRITGATIFRELHADRPFDVERSCLDISRIKNDFDWSPKVSLEEGIKRVWEKMNAT